MQLIWLDKSYDSENEVKKTTEGTTPTCQVLSQNDATVYDVGHFTVCSEDQLPQSLDKVKEPIHRISKDQTSSCVFEALPTT